MTLRRSTTLPPRTSPLKRAGRLRPVSQKQAKAKSRQQKANQVVDDTQPRYCIACGCSYNLSRSHVLTRKQFPQLAANPRNMVYLCWADHMKWEHDKTAFARDFPHAFAAKMVIMQELAPTYYAAFRGKHPHLFQS